MRTARSSHLGSATSQKAKPLTGEDADAVLVRLGSGQHGVIGHDQAIASGVDDGLLHRRVRAGRLERIEPRVFRLPGQPKSFEQRVMTAVLGAGPAAVASHRTAAALLALDGIPPDVVELSLGPNQRYPRCPTHRISDLARFDVTRVDGIPCTTATRTCVDLGGVVDDDVVERAFECAVRRRITTAEYADRRARALAQRGRAGPAALLRVLARRQELANDSDLETRFEQLCRAAGISGFRRQVPIGLYVVDFADPGRRLVIELDGLETHATSGALQADLTRQNLLVLQGWRVLRFTWDDVVRRGAAVAAALRSG